MKKVLFILMAAAAVGLLLNSEKGMKTLKKLGKSLDDIKDKALSDMSALIDKSKKWVAQLTWERYSTIKIHSPLNKPDAVEFISQAYKHCKAIAFEADASPLINKTMIGEDLKKNGNLAGIVMNSSTFIKGIKQPLLGKRKIPYLGYNSNNK